ncbi:DUF3055 family protein [Tumebacillus sp. DT12]|uniref:DUF3055 family protein n=1 Tax=Tumebacillus lacus TaxID=2995335 RepID=A0ABT3X2B6_9BACL|nr:SAV0927 family protein [Tumebacillus lacus]MCX7571033.1 DUF3055 family protein [Tumebacillus lacus]
MPRHIANESYEESRSRFVTLVTDHSQYDLVINYSSHFFGKALILLLQNNRFGIFDLHEVRDVETLGSKLGIYQQEDAAIISDYLEDVMPTVYTRSEL